MVRGTLKYSKEEPRYALQTSFQLFQMYHDVKTQNWSSLYLNICSYMRITLNVVQLITKKCYQGVKDTQKTMPILGNSNTKKSVQADM